MQRPTLTEYGSLVELKEEAFCEELRQAELDWRRGGMNKLSPRVDKRERWRKAS